MSDERGVESPAPSSAGAAADRDALPAAYRESLVETRRVLDVQYEMAEDTDEEILTVVRINLLALGGVVTLIAYVPDLITEALPWVVLSGAFLILSILLATYIYRGLTLYAGFGDHGYDKNVPRQKLPYGRVITTSADRTAPESPPVPETLPSATAFGAALLREHQAGINHNNVEIKYRSQIHQLVMLLLLVAIVILGIGIAVALSDGLPPAVWTVVAVATAGFVASGLYIVSKAAGFVYHFTQTSTDPERLSYGYAFSRKYPYLSRVCALFFDDLGESSDETR